MDSDQQGNHSVNHPRHYNSHPSGVECIDIAECFGFNFGSAIKYIWRCGLKADNKTEDIDKAIWYLKRERERIEKMEVVKKWI